MRFINTLTRLAFVCSAGAVTAEESFRFTPCNGSYQLFAAVGTATARTMSMPVGTAQATAATVQMGKCGREMIMTVQGMPVVLTQEIMNERAYSGTLNMGDGAARELTLTLDADRNLRGALVAKDSNLTVQRPMWLMQVSPSETRFEGCVDDPADVAPKAMTEEASAVASKMAALGLMPSEGLSYADYLTTQATGAGGVRVQIRLSADNEILPRFDVAARQLDPESAYCVGAKYIDPPHRILEFKVNYADDDPFAFARLVEMGTGKITSQQEGLPSVGDGTPLQNAIGDSWNKLTPTVGQMTNGITTGN